MNIRQKETKSQEFFSRSVSLLSDSEKHILDRITNRIEPKQEPKQTELCRHCYTRVPFQKDCPRCGNRLS